MRPYYYLGGNRGLTQLSNGQLFIVNTEARDIATWIIHAGVWETFVDDILCALARPGDTFLDIGSNMGYYAVKIGGVVLGGPSGRIFAYEPNPDLFEALYDNIQINGYGPRAVAFPVACGEAAGVTSLTFERRFPGGGTAGLGPEFAVDGREQTQVPVVRVDETVPDGEAHLIKIDVEGFEPLVIRGMTGLMQRSPDAAVVVEVSYSAWARFGDTARMLQDFAGDRLIFRIHTDGKLEALPVDRIDEHLHRNFPSYMLLLPNRPERLAQIQRFIGGSRPAEDINGLTQGRPPMPSLARRLKNRLARLSRR